MQYFIEGLIATFKGIMFFLLGIVTIMFLMFITGTVIHTENIFLILIVLIPLYSIIGGIIHMIIESV